MTLSSRIKSLDTLRGMLMVLMLFEHARQMLTGVVIMETKEAPAGLSGDALPLVIRSLSHLCAPGFFFLLGIGMVLHMRQSPSPRRVWTGFIKRGLLLVLLQFVAENGAWALPLLMKGQEKGEQGVLLYFGVLFCLGGSMVLTALLWRLKDLILFGVALVLVSSSLWNLPDDWNPWIGLVAGGFVGHSVEILYPLFPWSGLTLLGVLFARRAFCDGQLQRAWVLKVLAGLVAIFACWLLIFHVWAPSATAFYKYPPSPSYLLGALIALLLSLFAFSTYERLNLLWLQLVGRHALFFYLVHLYLLGFAALIFCPSSMMGIFLIALGVGMLTAFGCWWLEATKGLKLFNRFSPWYDRFMQRWGLYQVAAVQQVLTPQGPAETLLDVGGGTGYLAACVADRYARVVVTDLSPGMLSVARSRNLETVEASALDLPFKDGEFDVVLCTDALHHIKQIDQAIMEMCRVLKPGGTILIQEFHIQGWKGFFFYWFERLMIDDSVFVTPAELQAFLKKWNCSVEMRRLSSLGFMMIGNKRMNPS